MPKLSILIASLFILITSCKKDLDAQQDIVNDSAEMSANVNTAKGWYATYGIWVDGKGYIPQDTLKEYRLIRNGYIGLPKRSPDLKATINYDIPDIHMLNGDSLVYVFSISDSSNDQIITLTGDDGYLTVDHFHESWGVYTPDFGSTEYVEYQSFKSFRPVIITVKDKTISINTGQRLVFQISYHDKLVGRLRSIKLQYSSYMRCNYVNIFNSYTGKLLMKEAFNILGKSHTVFY